MKRNVKGVVFDLDHTLFDRYATLRRIAEIMPNDISPFIENIDRKMLGEIMVEVDRQNILFGWDAMFAAYKKLGILKPDVVREGFWKNYFRKLYFLCAIKFPFTEPMLKSLRQQGYKTGLITNGDNELQMKKLEMLGIAGLFDQITISGDTPFTKPDERIFTYFSGTFPVKPENCLYVGDHPKNDVEASRKAGFIPVWVKTSGVWLPELERAEYEINTVAEITDLIQKI